MTWYKLILSDAGKHFYYIKFKFLTLKQKSTTSDVQKNFVRLDIFASLNLYNIK